MNLHKNKLFWPMFIFVCIINALVLDAFDFINLSKMDTGEKLILMISYTIVGLLTRLWIKRNPKEIEKLFKIPD